MLIISMRFNLLTNPAYRIAPVGSPTLVFTYEHKVFCFGAHHQHNFKSITKTHYLAYWKVGSSSEGNATSIKGDRGIRGKRGATGEAGPIGPHGPKGDRSDIGPSGGAGVKGGRGGVGSPGPNGERGEAGLQG